MTMTMAMTTMIMVIIIVIVKYSCIESIERMHCYAIKKIENHSVDEVKKKFDIKEDN